MYRNRSRKHRKFSRNYRGYRERLYVREQPVWPLPIWNAVCPLIISSDPQGYEVELGYLALDGTPCIAERTPVFAVKSGIVTSVSISDGGVSISVDHLNCFSSDYTGLIEATVAPRTRMVKAGDVIGYAGGPSAPATMRFRVWRHITQGLPGFPLPFDTRSILKRYIFLDESALENTQHAA